MIKICPNKNKCKSTDGCCFCDECDALEYEITEGCSECNKCLEENNT